MLNAKLLFSNVSETSMNSSDNSTDSSEGSPMNHLEGPNIEAEKMLPSAVSEAVLRISCIHTCTCTCSLIGIHVQWNLRTMVTVGTGLLSIVGRLSLSQRLLNVCYNRFGASSFLQRLSASQSVHYQRFHCSSAHVHVQHLLSD